MAAYHGARQGGSVIVHETPKLDLDLYIQNYKGRTRFDRLLLIGTSSVALRTDALKAAVAEAKKGRDVGRYKQACRLLSHAAPSEPDAKVDDAWVTNTSRENTNDTNKLQEQLNSYKNNLIKESIRMGLEELGKHLESIGDLPGALEMYVKMRADVSTTKHIFETGMLIARIHLQNREWALVLASASKLIGQVEEEGAFTQWLRVIQGVSKLGMAEYAQAAQSFLSVSPTSKTAYSDIASPNDIATYGGLLALATMDRSQLQKKVLDDANFRSFLELEPHLRRAIGMFVNGRYSACLAILDTYKPDYFLDIYLQPHVRAIYALIRRKCIVQYFIPFSCVRMDLMEEQFGQDGETLEEELAAMIKSGELDARINSVDRLLTKETPDPRVEMQKKGLKTVDEYQKAALERIRRMSIAAAELEARGTKKSSVGPLSLQNIHDKLIDPSGLMGAQEGSGS